MVRFRRVGALDELYIVYLYNIVYEVKPVVGNGITASCDSDD